MRRRWLRGLIVLWLVLLVALTAWQWNGQATRSLTFEDALLATQQGVAVRPAAMERLRELVCKGIRELRRIETQDLAESGRATRMLEVVAEELSR